MAEALAAVGLAANILQFIDVGSRYVSRAWKIYRSGSARAAEILDAEVINNDLRDILAQLSTSRRDRTEEAEREAGLSELVNRCRILVDKLLSSLQKIGLPQKGGKKRDAIKGAFQMMCAVAKETGEALKLCIFVDGLDEFGGQLNDLIDLFNSLVGNYNLKLCVSSRPWTEFEDAFQDNPSMMLQDLTYTDIKSYVTSNLQNDPGFASLRRSERHYADNLIENVVSKASGVFLWVHLVVASLLTGMGNRDRIIDLQRRLDLLPPELEDLYDKMLESLDLFYLEHAAQLFKLTQECHDPPPLLLLSFADEEDPVIALDRSVRQMAQEDVDFREDTIRRRLNSRCKGFLEVGRSSSHVDNTEQTVQYLHRTVKDYIEGTKAQQSLRSALHHAFDPHMKLCFANLSHLKVIAHDKNILHDGSFWKRVRQCLYSAARMESVNHRIMVRLLDELDKTGGVLAKKVANHIATTPLFETKEHNYLTSLLESGQWVPSYPESMNVPGFGANYLSLLVRYGIIHYVEAKANPGCLVQHHRNGVWPLLYDAVNSDLQDISGYDDMIPRPEMVSCLLKKGADPDYKNSRVPGLAFLSVWQQTIRIMVQDGTETTSEPCWNEIARVMISCGAELDKATFLDVIRTGTPQRTINVPREPYRFPDHGPLPQAPEEKERSYSSTPSPAEKALFDHFLFMKKSKNTYRLS